MNTREATNNDWEMLSCFFGKIYRHNHPLQSNAFWNWQFGNENFGRSFICEDKGRVVGHVGANFGGGIAWIINVYLEEEYRGKGILRQLYNLARSYYPLGATAANNAGLGLYRNMRWIRYYDLVRYVKINPNIKEKHFENICKPVNISVDHLEINDTHYFKQPGIKGVLIEKARAISQENVGGLRVVEYDVLSNLELKAWELGYLWMDYITSWNDIKIKNLIKNDWIIDHESVVPWRLDPVEKGYYCDITFLSEKPLDREFVVHKSYSDHGRIGSL